MYYTAASWTGLDLTELGPNSAFSRLLCWRTQIYAPIRHDFNSFHYPFFAFHVASAAAGQGERTPYVQYIPHNTCVSVISLGFDWPSSQANRLDCLEMAIGLA